MSIPSANTQLNFRPFEFADHERIYPLERRYRNCNDSFEDFLAKATRESALGKTYLDGDYSIIEKMIDGEFVGYVRKHRPAFSDVYEIWIYLLPEHQGVGYGKLACLWVCQRAFLDPQITEVMGRVRSDNSDSLRLVRRMGFVDAFENLVPDELHWRYFHLSRELFLRKLE